MSDSSVPQFFAQFPMQQVDSATLDAALVDGAAPITILFLWGRDCPNCDIAKRQVLQAPQRYRWPEVRWLHGNVYEDASLGTRFGLHGIPTFILFRGTRRLGRISPWPGPEPFCAAVAAQIAALGNRDGAMG